MKKLLALILSLISVFTFAFAVVGCTPATPSYDGAVKIYMPDGAPALAFAKLMHDENKLGKDDLTYTVVSANNIGGVVANGTATAALMPINAASKLCGTGDRYKILSVNTHGNLYVLSKQTPDGIDSLKGKKVGVINLANVPGLTFKAILKKNEITYTEDESAHTSTSVFLKNIEAGQVAALLNATDNAKLDYVVAPEPQVSKLTTAAPVIKNVLSLQTLWGEDSYPQAVLVVKNELAQDAQFCNALLSALSESATWVKTHGEDAYNAISAHTAEGYATTLAPTVLTESAITGCNIKVIKANEMKATINDYIQKIIEIEPTSASVVSDNFFI